MVVNSKKLVIIHYGAEWKRLCDYRFRWTNQVMEKTYTQASGLRVACQLQDVTGETVNISEYLDFGLYGIVS